MAASLPPRFAQLRLGLPGAANGRCCASALSLPLLLARNVVFTRLPPAAAAAESARGGGFKRWPAGAGMLLVESAGFA